MFSVLINLCNSAWLTVRDRVNVLFPVAANLTVQKLYTPVTNVASDTKDSTEQTTVGMSLIELLQHMDR